MVVAAGNDGRDSCSTSPSGSPGALTVGASNEQDARATFSNFGPCVGVFAPGTSITSTSRTGAYESTQGTSQAAPFVTGVAALYLQINPNALPADVNDAIRSVALEGVLKDTNGSPNVLLQAIAAPPGFKDGADGISL